MEIVHEEWRPVVGEFAGWNYEVSNLGQVKSTSTYRKVLTGKIKTQHISNAGYPILVLSHNNKYRNVNVHKLVAEAFISVRPEGMQVNHKDGCKTNNRADNLEWITVPNNMRHAITTGLKRVHSGETPRLQGENNPRAKLTAEKVRAIRAAHAAGEKPSSLARQYDIRKEAIWKILWRKSWKHVA